MGRPRKKRETELIPQVTFAPVTDPELCEFDCIDEIFKQTVQALQKCDPSSIVYEFLQSIVMNYGTMFKELATGEIERD